MLKNTGVVSFEIDVKKRLLDLDKTQLELANKTGMNYQYLSQGLSKNCKQKFSDEMRQKILDVLEKWEREG